MANTDITWTGDCRDCINGVDPNKDDRWVQLSCCNGKKDVGGLLEGTGSTDIIVSSLPATSYGQKSECTVTFTSENGDIVQCQVIRCPYGCSCASYNFKDKITSIGSEGYTGTVFSIESQYGCPIDESSNGFTFYPDHLHLDTKGTIISPDGKIIVPVKGNFPSNNGDNSNIDILIYFSNNLCETISLGQDVVNCDCNTKNIVIADTLKNKISAMGITTPEIITITSTCPRAGQTFDITCNETWVTIVPDGNSFKITIEGRTDENAYLLERSATLQVVSIFNGVRTNCETITLTQSQAGCACNAFSWSNKDNKEITISNDGVTNEIIDESKYTIDCGDNYEVEFLCISGSDATITANTMSDDYHAEEYRDGNDRKVQLTAPAYTGCDEDYRFFVVPHIDGGVCVNNGGVIKVRQEHKNCTGCDDVTITPTAQSVTFDAKPIQTKAIATATFNGNQSESSKYTLYVVESPGWVDVNIDGFKVSATTTGTCTDSCTNKTDTITIGWKYNDEDICPNKHVEISVTQKCEAQISIKIIKVDGVDYNGQTLNCEGGPVEFGIEYVNGN